MTPSPRLNEFFKRPLAAYHSFGDTPRRWLRRGMIVLTVVALGWGAVNTVPGMWQDFWRDFRADQVNRVESSRIIDLSDPMGQQLSAAALDLARELRSDPAALRHQRDWRNYTPDQKLAVLEIYQAKYLSHFPGMPDLPLRAAPDLAAESTTTAYVMNYAGALTNGHAGNRQDYRPHVYLNMGRLAKNDLSFQTYVNVIVHESVHTIQQAYIARAFLDMLDSPSVRADTKAFIQAKAPAFRQMAGNVQLPGDVAAPLNRMLRESHSVLFPILYGYYLKTSEQQAYKVGECMLAATRLPPGALEKMPSADQSAAFQACGADYRHNGGGNKATLHQHHHPAPRG